MCVLISVHMSVHLSACAYVCVHEGMCSQVCAYTDVCVHTQMSVRRVHAHSGVPLYVIYVTVSLVCKHMDGWQLEQVWVPVNTRIRGKNHITHAIVSRAPRSSGKLLVRLLTLLPRISLSSRGRAYGDLSRGRFAYWF